MTKWRIDMCKVDELQRSSTSQGSGAFVKTWQWRQWLVSLSAKKHKLKTNFKKKKHHRPSFSGARMLHNGSSTTIISPTGMSRAATRWRPGWFDPKSEKKSWIFFGNRWRFFVSIYTNLFHKTWRQERHQTERDNQDWGWWSLEPPASLPRSWYPGHPGGQHRVRATRKATKPLEPRSRCSSRSLSASETLPSCIPEQRGMRRMCWLEKSHLSAQFLYFAELVKGLPKEGVNVSLQDS